MDGSACSLVSMVNMVGEVDLKCLNYVEINCICKSNVNKFRKLGKIIFFSFDKILSFAKLVNLTNLT